MKIVLSEEQAIQALTTNLSDFLRNKISKGLAECVAESQADDSESRSVIVDWIFSDEKLETDGGSLSGFEINEENSGRKISEAKDHFQRVPDTKYSYRIDPPRGEPGPGNLRHIHIYKKDKHVFALNSDGTAHDGCHNVKIDPSLTAFLLSKDFPIPSNGIIEMRDSRAHNLLFD